MSMPLFNQAGTTRRWSKSRDNCTSSQCGDCAGRRERRDQVRVSKRPAAGERRTRERRRVEGGIIFPVTQRGSWTGQVDREVSAGGGNRVASSGLQGETTAVNYSRCSR